MGIAQTGATRSAMPSSLDAIFRVGVCAEAEGLGHEDVFATCFLRDKHLAMAG
jgi:hypothetical protein